MLLIVLFLKKRTLSIVQAVQVMLGNLEQFLIECPE